MTTLRLAAILLVAAGSAAAERPSSEAAEFVDLEGVSSSDVLDRVISHGAITVHPKFERFAKPGGTLHLRLMDLSIRRPLTFKVFEDVRFPLAYRITRRDAVSPVSWRESSKSEFYAEAFYAPPGRTLHDEERANAIGGEAWGPTGKPWPLRMGQRADIVLASFWTPALYAGRLAKRQGALMEGWLDVTRELRGKLTPRNRLTVLVLEQPPSLEAARKPRVLAAKAYEDVRADRLPVSFHFFPEDFRVRPIDPYWRAYFLARLDCFDPPGTLVAVLQGGRASQKVGITAFPRRFRIIVNYDLTGSPLRTEYDVRGAIDLEQLGLKDLKASPITDD